MIARGLPPVTPGTSVIAGDYHLVLRIETEVGIATTSQERWVEVPGGRLWAASDGDGPPIALLHAGIAEAAIWEPFIPRLTDAGYRSIRYDARGFGPSTTEDVEHRRADDLRAVLDAFDVERACLVGNSQGGTIALDFAVLQPERVAALVMLASGIGGLEVEMSPRDEAVQKRYVEVDGAGDLEALTDFEVALWGAGVEQPVDRLPADLRATLRPMVLAANVNAEARGRPVPLDPPAAERLDRLSMPVLFIHGALDFSHTETYGRILEERLPNARLVVLPDVAHMVALEAPDETARLILELVRPLGRFD
jgi:pimeloyl-ACP methyl ester carboxylesterase